LHFFCEFSSGNSLFRELLSGAESQKRSSGEIPVSQARLQAENTVREM
jgi:hypothetical protein